MSAPTTGRPPIVRPWILLSLLLGSAACGDGVRDPSDAPAGEAVPDSFLVAFETSAGDFQMKLIRAWSPVGVERIYELADMNFYAGARIYRVNASYAQFGYTGRPDVDSVWVGAGLPDEPPQASNVRGAVSFARGGPETRSVILFINRSNNSTLDQREWRGVLGFPPVGRIDAGMDVVDALHDGYGEEPLMWEDSIATLGNDFLDRRYPGLDSIIAVRIVEHWR